MMHSNQPAQRLTRLGRLGKSVLVAGVSTLIALLSHVLAGGPIPALSGIVVPLVLAAVICLPLSGRLHSLPRLIPAVLLSQLLYHWLFVLGAPSSGVLVATGGAALLGLLRLVQLLASAILPALPVLAPLGTSAPRAIIAAPRRRTPTLRRLAETVTRRGPPLGVAPAIA